MRSSLVGSLVLVACVTRPLEEGATEGTSTNETGLPPATAGTTGVSTTDPVTTGPTSEPATTGAGPTTDPGTSTSTSTTGITTSTPEPLTGGMSSSVTTDVSTSGDPSGTSGDKLDLPQPPPDDAALVGCTFDAPPGTALAGFTVQGPFEGDRAYFGGQFFDGDLVMPTFMFLSTEAVADIELSQQLGTSGEILLGVALTQPFGAWIGDWTFDGLIIDNGVNGPVAVQLEITGFAGSWDVPDPDDPPRLVGALTGEVVGHFDAVFCNNLNIIPPP